jgi:uncharacterized repeat protein (TIGR01451 family)
MKLQYRHALKFLALFLLTQIVLLFFIFHRVAQAQESTPFQIRLIPAAEHAVSGQPFTYTVIITNVSPAPVQSAVINVDVPDGTKFLRTHYIDPKWYGGNSYADPNLTVERVQLLTPETIEVGEIFTFTLVVEVLAEPDEAVRLDDYQVTAIEDRASTSGPVVAVAVRQATPTPTITSSPSPSASPSPTASPTVTATSAPATRQAALPPTVAPPQPVVVETAASPAGLSLVTVGLIGAAAILILAGVVLFLRRR